MTGTALLPTPTARRSPAEPTRIICSEKWAAESDSALAAGRPPDTRASFADVELGTDGGALCSYCGRPVRIVDVASVTPA